MKTKGWAVCAIVMAAALAAFSGQAGAAETGHGSMPGMQHGGAKAEGHDMGKMGDKVFGGKIGPWTGEARLMDMKAHMEKAMASGMKMEGTMKQTHHVAVSLTDPKSKKAVTEGKGAVTVVGPDKSEEKSDFMVMDGHFGADVTLSKPGKYTFKVAIESGGQKGAATFSHAVK